MAIIVPLKDPLLKFAGKMSAGYSNMSYPELCKDAKIVEVQSVSIVLLSMIHYIIIYYKMFDDIILQLHNRRC